MPDRVVTQAQTASNSPVEFIHTDAPDTRPEQGIGLCLSGGGYRAMLFHTGALWRLNQLGYLPRLSRVSSVSGGSITAAVLALNWKQLNLDSAATAEDHQFISLIVDPIRKLATRTIDVESIVSGFRMPRS